MTQPVKIQSVPGIKRDGTRAESQSYVDGTWCRFQRGKPRKMGGFNRVSNQVTERTRGMPSYSNDGINHLHLGSATELYQYNINNSGGLAARSDRTPTALVDSVNNLWQFTAFWDTVIGNTRIIAHAAPNLADIDNSTEALIFHGEAVGTAVFSDVAMGMRDVSGGIVSLQPYLFAYGNDGELEWSVINNFASFPYCFLIYP